MQSSYIEFRIFSYNNILVYKPVITTKMHEMVVERPSKNSIYTQKSIVEVLHLVRFLGPKETFIKHGFSKV